MATKPPEQKFKKHPERPPESRRIPQISLTRLITLNQKKEEARLTSRAFAFNPATGDVGSGSPSPSAVFLRLYAKYPRG
jgi:hypothetical protein